MNGKGDKRRPSTVDKNTFDNNWDKIFNKKTKVLDGMWEHNCKHNGLLFCSVDEACNWCGVKEDGSFD